jgi:hypothetical protein
LLAGFALSHPTILPDSQALLIGMARYTCFMLELESVMKGIDPSNKRMLIARKGKDKWSSLTKCNMEMVLGSSPSGSVIDNWVINLAIEQAMIVLTFFQNCGAVYLMSDGGHKGSQVKLLPGWDKQDTSQTLDGSVPTIILYIDASGKKSEDVVTGCVYSLEKIGIESSDGLTNDSGAGTPESLVSELIKEKKMVEGFAFSDLCTLHDLQSIFCLPIWHYMGNGGLDNRNVMQLIHAVWDMFAKFKEYFASDTWRRVLSRMWKEIKGACLAPTFWIFVVETKNKQQTTMTMIATPSPNGMSHASIPTRTTPIPIPMIQTLTQQSTPLHNGKVRSLWRRSMASLDFHRYRDPIDGFELTAHCFSPSTLSVVL